MSTPEAKRGFSSFEWLGLRSSLLITGIVWVLPVVVLMIGFGEISSTLLFQGLALGVIPAFAMGLYLRAINTTKQENEIGLDDLEDAWKLDVVPENMTDDGWRFEAPTYKEFERLRPKLLSAEGQGGDTAREDRVRVVTREHKISLYLRTLIPWFFTFLFLIALLGCLIGEIPIPWWIPLIGLILCLVIRWVMAMKWKYGLVMVTDWGVRIAPVPPVWLPWWQPQPERLAYDEMDEVTVDTSFWGTMIGKVIGPGRSWGTIVLIFSANVGHDQRRIPRMPNYLELQEQIETARRSYKLLISGRRASPVVDTSANEAASVTAMQELTLALQQLRDRSGLPSPGESESGQPIPPT